MSKKTVINIKNLIGTLIVTDTTDLQELQKVVNETLVKTIKSVEDLSPD